VLLKFIGDGGSSFRAEERHNRMSLNFKFWVPTFLKRTAPVLPHLSAQFTLNNERVGCDKLVYEDFSMAE